MEKEEILKKLDARMLDCLNDAVDMERRCPPVSKAIVHFAIGIMHAASALELFTLGEFININHTLCNTSIGKY